MHRAAHIAALVLFASFAVVVHAQDLALISIDEPRSGCALLPGENVTIRMFNHGTNQPAGSAFDLSYQINAGVPITELAILGSNLLKNSTFRYTFATPADLQVPGTYTFDATVSLPGDINPSNNARTGYSADNTSPRIAGTLVGPAPPSTFGTLTLGGSTGPIAQWEESVDGGLRWFALANTGTTQDFADLRRPTKFRVRMQGAPCGPDVLSNVVTVSP